jgi:hypothetical protein
MDNNHIKQVADTIYRMNKKVNLHINKENAGKDALKSIYEGRGADILAIEMEKAGDLKTLSNRINERLDLIHTHVLRVCEELSLVHPFKKFDRKDLTPEVIEKAKGNKGIDTAITKAKSAAMKAFEDALKGVFSAELTRKLVTAIKDTYAIAEKREHELVDRGALKRKYTSDFVD